MVGTLRFAHLSLAKITGVVILHEPPPNEWTPVVGSESQEVSNGRKTTPIVYGRLQAPNVLSWWCRAAVQSRRLRRNSVCATRCCVAGSSSSSRSRHRRRGAPPRRRRRCRRTRLRRSPEIGRAHV